MKKLMIVAAVAAMSFASNAGLALTECPSCGVSEPQAECDVIVFKVTGSGKTVANKKDYKSVQSLKIKKGAIALVGSYCATTGDCCYDSGIFYATIKAGKSEFKMATEIVPTVWSVFGKDYDAVNTKNAKVGKKYKLESALCIESEGESIIIGDSDGIEDITFAASGFGQVIAEFPKAGKSSKNGSVCGKSTTLNVCDPVVTPKKYKGWFVGKMACLGPEGCFLCDCADTDAFGGTWKASYQEKATSLSDARKIADVSQLDEDL